MCEGSKEEICIENKELDMDDRGCYTYDKDGVHASTNTVAQLLMVRSRHLSLCVEIIDMAHAMKVQKL